MNPNQFDRLEVDIDALHKQTARGELPVADSIYCVDKKMRRRIERGIWERLVDSGWERRWFEEFERYWRSNLGGRRLSLHDFYYLKSSYRARFQDLDVPEGADAEEFLKVWQRPECIHITFHTAYRYAVNPLWYWTYRRAFELIEQGNILEYGAGAAPIVTSMLRGGIDRYSYTLADIRGFSFHYAKYLLSHRGVDFVDIVPYEPPRFQQQFDLVFLLTVLEHLPNPLDVIEHLYEAIRPGGILVFDYPLSEGQAMDTKESLHDRKAVLEFIEENFELIEGSLLYSASMGRTIARRK